MSSNLYYEIILGIMKRERQAYWDSHGGKFTHRMPTFLIRRYFNQESVLELTGPELRKAMISLSTQGFVTKHPDSRNGQSYWQLTEKEWK